MKKTKKYTSVAAGVVARVGNPGELVSFHDDVGDIETTVGVIRISRDITHPMLHIWLPVKDKRKGARGMNVRFSVNLGDMLTVLATQALHQFHPKAEAK